MHGGTGKQLMRAERSVDAAAADKVAVDRGTAELVFDKQREPAPEAPLDASEHLPCRAGDLIFVGSRRLRRCCTLHLDMRIGEADPGAGIGNHGPVAQRAAPDEIDGEEIVAVGEFKPLERGGERLLCRNRDAVPLS
jgi:hypothetical protein